MDEKTPHNLLPSGRKLRLMMGALLALFSTGLIVLLLALGLGPAWRLTAALPLWACALCFLQTRARTCVFLAGRGLRETAAGTAPVEDARECLELTRLGHRLHLQALVVAAAATAVLLLIPA